MAKQQDTVEKSMTAEQAMNEVLEAEQNAKQRVEQCHVEAEHLLQQTRQQAQQIMERVDNRISRVHQRCSRAVTDQVKQIKLAQEQMLQESDQSDLHLETLDAVVEKIARRLTIPEHNPEHNSN